ncbi:hypothetical protein EV644_103102 [Kribbella orskensis]|uniref:Zinc finger protein n=1 Tax=Kribbella orskensis TaxID=2512216 RepID=A0ABY2BPH9_9ACTN|nr:hypothetical protein EV642_106318 [Kribbella sp. VKM Ac-2500]TCO27405.1 hypothetical protein EV644_103102 [Kribbella orskensis]
MRKPFQIRWAKDEHPCTVPDLGTVGETWDCSDCGSRWMVGESPIPGRGMASYWRRLT